MATSPKTSTQRDLLDTDQITPCSVCEKVPENFVAMNCGHNYCLICLSKIYLSSTFLPMRDGPAEEYQCVVLCELCNGLTELDSTSIEALEIFIQDFFSKSNEVYNEIIYEESNETNQTEEQKIDDGSSPKSGEGRMVTSSEKKKRKSFEYEYRNEYASLDIPSDLLDERPETHESDARKSKKKGVDNDSSIKNLSGKTEKKNNRDRDSDPYNPLREKKEKIIQPQEKKGLKKDAEIEKDKDCLPLCKTHTEEEAILFCLSCFDNCMCVECFIQHKKQKKKGAPHEITNILSKNSLKELKKAADEVWENIAAKADVFKLFEKNILNKGEAFKNRIHLVKLHITESFQEIRKLLEAKEEEALTVIESYAETKLKNLEDVSQSIDKHEKFVSSFEKILKSIDNNMELQKSKQITNKQRADIFNLVASERVTYLSSLDSRVEETVQEISKSLGDINESLSLDIGLWKELSKLERINQELKGLNVTTSLETFLSAPNRESTVMPLDRTKSLNKLIAGVEMKLGSGHEEPLYEQRKNFKKKQLNKPSTLVGDAPRQYNPEKQKISYLEKDRIKHQFTPKTPEVSLNFSQEKGDENIIRDLPSEEASEENETEQREKMKFYDRVLTDILSSKRETTNSETKNSGGNESQSQSYQQKFNMPNQQNQKQLQYGTIKSTVDEIKSSRKRVKKTPGQANSHSSTMGYDSQKKTLNTLDDSYGSNNHSTSRKFQDGGAAVSGPSSSLAAFNKSLERKQANRLFSPLKKEEALSLSITSPIHIKSPSLGSFSVRDSINFVTSPGRKETMDKRYFFSMSGSTTNTYMEEILQRQREKFDRKRSQFFFA